MLSPWSLALGYPYFLLFKCGLLGCWGFSSWDFVHLFGCLSFCLFFIPWCPRMSVKDLAVSTSSVLGLHMWAAIPRWRQNLDGHNSEAKKKSIDQTISPVHCSTFWYHGLTLSSINFILKNQTTKLQIKQCQNYLLFVGSLQFCIKPYPLLSWGACGPWLTGWTLPHQGLRQHLSQELQSWQGSAKTAPFSSLGVTVTGWRCLNPF